MFLKLFSTANFSALKVSWKNQKIPGFSGKKLPENFFPGRKFRETSRELDLGQDRPTQRVSAKSVYWESVSEDFWQNMESRERQNAIFAEKSILGKLDFSFVSGPTDQCKMTTIDLGSFHVFLKSCDFPCVLYSYLNVFGKNRFL